MNKWAGITGLVHELKRCEHAGHLTGALALAYICIDTMTFLSLPEGRPRQTHEDFIEWVDTYLKAHADQPYQYRGNDVYAARCAFLHVYGSEASRHTHDPDARIFLYNDGGRHALHSAAGSRYVMIGVVSFLNDVVEAVDGFLKDCLADATLRARVDARLGGILQTFSIDRG